MNSNNVNCTKEIYQTQKGCVRFHKQIPLPMQIDLTCLSVLYEQLVSLDDLINRLWFIVARKYVFTLRQAENDRSLVALVAGITRIRRNIVTTSLKSSLPCPRLIR